MKTTHTPGPWAEYERTKDNSIIISGERLVCHVYNWSTPSPAKSFIEENEQQRLECEANARLIAAAPDLLAALKDLHKNISFLRDSIEGNERLDLDESLDLIVKAIKKATDHH